MTCFGEDYQTKFGSKIYLEKMYKELDYPLSCLRLMLMEWHKEFMNPDHKGGKILDLGSGPSIHLALLGSRVYNEITLSDFTDSNRDELLKWVNKEKDAFDWKQVSDFIGELENREPSMIIERTRQAVKEVIPVNLVHNNIFHPNTQGKYDCVVSSLCLEECYRDLTSYKNGIIKIADHVTEGGILALFGTLGQTYYKVGSHHFHALPVNKQDIENSLQEAGFELREMKVIDPEEQTEENAFTSLSYDCAAFYFLSARKVLKKRF